MNREIDQQKVEQITVKAEQGQSLNDDLNSMPWEERAAYVRAMDKLNEERRQADPNLPDIIVDWGKGAEEDAHVMDIETEGTAWNSDVYDLPRGNWLPENFAVAADTTHSDSLRKPKAIDELLN